MSFHRLWLQDTDTDIYCHQVQVQKYQEQQELLNKRLVAMYESGTTSYLDMLLSSEGLSDFISKYYLVSELATCDKNLIETIRQAKATLETEKTEVIPFSYTASKPSPMPWRSRSSPAAVRATSTIS